MNNYPGSGIYDRLQAEGRYVVPRFIERTSQGVREYDPYAKLFEERVIFLGVQIDDASANDVMAQLLYLESVDPDRDITMYINSPGGSFTSLMAIYDTMQYVRPDIQTVCLGQAASMGSLLLCGGAPGQRFVLPHSRIMVHQVSGGYSGQASDIAIHAKEILRVREQLNLIYKRHLTKEHSLQEIERVMERDFFMGAEEAKEWGIVDKILDRREDANVGGGK